MTEFDHLRDMAKHAPRQVQGAWAKYRHVYVWRNSDGSHVIAKCFIPRRKAGEITKGRWVIVPDAESKEITDGERAKLRELVPELFVTQPQVVQETL